MKYTDIQRLHEAGLISEDQRRKIIAHFQLREEGGKLLAILSMVGAVLIAAGIALLIAAHWNGISRGVKIAAGIVLMLGAQAAGWWLREGQGEYRKTGEALHLVGSCLFLANIALLGQIYNMVSRPPNAFLAWWLGIAALPWLLRSKAQHILLLLGFGIWFGFEINQADSWIRCNSEHQALLYSLLGLVYLGVGWILRRSSFAEFAPPSEKLGLLIFLACAYPSTWKNFFGTAISPDAHSWIFPALAAVAILLIASGTRNLTTLDRQWRWTWFGALAGLTAFMATVWFGLWQLAAFGGPHHAYWQESWSYVPGALALFVYCLLQIQVGIQERSSFLVNLGVVFIALDIIAAYCDLFGSMARTGFMFVIGGAFLIGFGVYLEKKRRAFMRRIKLQPQQSDID
ncbi:MAG: DUF2157 domain-containing protein [Verrucomicrobiota bacterium]|jgi:uncharacterized membrane protein